MKETFLENRLCTARIDNVFGKSTGCETSGRCAPGVTDMENMSETSVKNNSGRKRTLRECEQHAEHLWCGPCLAGHRKKKCEGLKAPLDATPAEDPTDAQLKECTMCTPQLQVPNSRPNCPRSTRLVSQQG